MRRVACEKGDRESGQEEGTKEQNTYNVGPPGPSLKYQSPAVLMPWLGLLANLQISALYVSWRPTSGAIDVEELQTALEMLGIHKSEEEVAELMDGVDEDGSGA